jgi:hypothetical protein
MKVTASCSPCLATVWTCMDTTTFLHGHDNNHTWYNVKAFTWAMCSNTNVLHHLCIPSRTMHGKPKTRQRPASSSTHSCRALLTPCILVNVKHAVGLKLVQ